MIKYKNIQKVDIQLESMTCDFCGYVYEGRHRSGFLNINHFGIDDSLFGDGTHVMCDICEKCLHTMINEKCKKYRDDE